MILGIDGGATASKALLLDASGKILARSRGAPSNSVLQSDDQIFRVLQGLWEEVAPKAAGLRAVAICLAGVVNTEQQKKVEAIARELWFSLPIFVSHDLRSGLYAGAPSGSGVVVIAGTGASVFAKRDAQEIRGGGWGHVLGDAGSGYHIAHMALRNITANYDHQGKMGPLGHKILKATASKSLEELSAYVSRTEKHRIAELSALVFKEASRGNRDAKKILDIASDALASNVSAIVKRLGGRHLPILLTGGVFEKQKSYRDLFTRHLRKTLGWASPQVIKEEASIGAALWGRECLNALKITKTQAPKVKKSTGGLTKLLASVNFDEISTEESNPRTRELSRLPTRQAVDLFLKEDEAIVPALRECSAEITEAVELSTAALKAGGRLIYVGAGTSGRLGILDASECPPTFRSAPGQVVAVIAGGAAAIQSAVEGAEDNRRLAERSLTELELQKTDCVVGIAASGRTPFVLSALEFAGKRGAATVFITCNSKLRNASQRRAKVEIHLATGPEVLTGSTRLKAGTATKILLNIISTLSMTKLGKVSGNFMVDVHPTNDKLKVRALKIFTGLTGDSLEKAWHMLEQSNWHLKRALQLSGKSHL